MAASSRTRADHLVVEQGIADTGAKAQAMIMAGEIFAGERRVDKPGEELPSDTVLTFHSSRPRYASRGGGKLAGALTTFNMDVAGWTVLDIGASTGGFTDCLLQHGAARVVAVDVGKNLLDDKLRADDRVTVVDECNARHLTAHELPSGVTYDLATVDVSFISLRLILPPLAAVGIPRILALVKPQFEVGKGEGGKGGVVRDPALHSRVANDVRAELHRLGYTVAGPEQSPLKGPKGNIEFFLFAEHSTGV